MCILIILRSSLKLVIPYGFIVTQAVSVATCLDLFPKMCPSNKWSYD